MRKALFVGIENGAMVIRLPIDTLAWAAENGPLSIEENPLRIKDQTQFSESILRALEDEEEDGSTPVTRMFDRAMEWVLEQGEDGPDYGDLDA